MDDPLLVSGFERLGDLPRDRQRLVQRNRRSSNAVGQRRPLDELHDKCFAVGRVLEPVHRGDVRMIQRREDFGFALKP